MEIRSHKAVECVVKRNLRMHHIKIVWLFNCSSKCFEIILTTGSVVLLNKYHFIKINPSRAIGFKWTCNFKIL